MSNSNTSANKNVAGDAIQNIKIDIISDTMCPWCFVGKRNMEEALREMPQVNADVTWHPYFLDKTLPEDGKLVEDYYMGNYRDPKAGKRMEPALIQAGRLRDIDFETNYVKLTHYRPTIRSHRLIALAKRQDKQDTMVEEIFQMYFEKGKHLNSIEELVAAAKKVGLEGDIQAYLESDEGEQEVFEEAAHEAKRAKGVPTFIFSKPGEKTVYAFSGGQPPEAFHEVFDALSSS